jgi:hypothetical protein
MLKPVITTAVLPRGLGMVGIKMLAGNNKSISIKRWKDPALMILCQSGEWNKRWQQEFFNPTEEHMLFVLKVLCFKYWLVSNVGVISVLSSCVWGLLLLGVEFGDSSILLCNAVQWPPWMQCMVTCNLIRDSQSGCPMVVIPVGMDGPTLVALAPLSLHCKHLIRFPC